MPHDYKLEMSDRPINLINGLLFMLDNNYKDNLIKCLRDNGNTVSVGPQVLRGSVNSINSFLNRLEIDYKNSLYLHHDHHYHFNVYITSSIYTINKLGRKKF